MLFILDMHLGKMEAKGPIAAQKSPSKSYYNKKCKNWKAAAEDTPQHRITRGCSWGFPFPSLHLILTQIHERSLSCPAMWPSENKLQRGINQRLNMLEQPQKKITVAAKGHCSFHSFQPKWDGIRKDLLFELFNLICFIFIEIASGQTTWASEIVDLQDGNHHQGRSDKQL